MTIPDPTLDEAYMLFSEFGPDILIDRSVWLRSDFPQLSVDKVSEVLVLNCGAYETVW
jgi:uncharacterized protein (DUF488 family)